MSSSTDNLGLTLPADGERLSLGVLNQNWNTVDEFAGDCININLGSFASLTALATILDAALSSMRSAGVKAFQVNCTTASAPFKVLTYLCTLYKSGTNTTFAHATFRSVSSSEVIIARRTGNGWGEWQQLAVTNTLSTENVLSTIAATFTAIATSDARIVYTKQGIFNSLQFKFKCSSAITTGSVTLPTSITGSLTEVESALASLDGNGGMAQLVGRTLYIRCGASSTNFLFGQLNWVA